MNDVLTPSQTSGPLFGFALLREDLSLSIDPSDPNAVRIQGRITDGTGAPLVHEAFVEFWSADQATRARAMEDGRYEVVMARPAASALPDGRVLAPHLHFAVFGRGLSRQVITRMYFPDEIAANAADPVLELVDPASRATLVAHDGNEAGTLRFDIRLQGDGETVFFRLEA